MNRRTRFKCLTIGNFRGFSAKQEFDLDAGLLLFYGPNGMGKSTVFQAIEFALFPVDVLADWKKENGESAPLTNRFYDSAQEESKGWIELEVEQVNDKVENWKLCQDVVDNLAEIEPGDGATYRNFARHRRCIFFTQRLLRDLILDAPEQRYFTMKRLLDCDGYDLLIAILRDWMKERQMEGLARQSETQEKFLEFVKHLQRAIIDLVHDKFTERVQATSERWQHYHAELSAYSHFQHVEVELKKVEPEDAYDVRFLASDATARDHVKHQMAALLSEGQLRCAAVSLAMSLTDMQDEEKILALDDPFGSWDEVNSENFMGVLRRRVAAGWIVILTTNDRNMLVSAHRNMETVQVENSALLYTFANWSKDAGPTWELKRVEPQATKHLADLGAFEGKEILLPESRDPLAPVNEIRVRRQQGNSQEALALFPPNWQSQDDSEVKALLALEYGFCRYQLQETEKALDYIDLAYSLRDYVTTPERYLDIIVAQLRVMREGANFDKIPSLASSAYKAKRAALNTSAGRDLLWHWGWAEHKLGHYEESVQRLGEAIALKSERDAQKNWEINLYLAEVHLENKQLAQARLVLEGVQRDELDARLTLVWYRQMATLYLAENHFEKAGDLVEAAVEFGKSLEHKREKAQLALLAGQIRQSTTGKLTDAEIEHIISLCSEVGDDALVMAARGLKL